MSGCPRKNATTCDRERRSPSYTCSRRSEKPRNVHSLGWAGLTTDEIQQMRVFIERLDSEYEANRITGKPGRQYVIHPHVRETDDRCSFRRFNCAEFVIEAYRYAGIDVVVTDPEQLPGVELDTIVRAYPDHRDSLNNSRFRARLGLEGDEPWPVVLAGYVLNALNRSVEDIRSGRYAPKDGDEFFPSRGD